MSISNQKGIAQLFILLILFAGLIAGLYLVQHRQIFKPKAANSPDFAKNILLANSEAPLDTYGNRIVFQSDKPDGQNPRYYVEYQPPFDLFILAINKAPIEQVREEAEKDLLQRSGNDLQTLCSLNFQVVASKKVTEDGYFASDNKLAICKELQSQSNNPPAENFTPSLVDTIQSIGSAITEGGGRSFLSNKPIVASENLPAGVYITLCRNNGTIAEGVWQIRDNLQAADINTPDANQESGRCNWPVPNYLVFTQDVPVGAYLTLCNENDESQSPQESFWQIDNSGRIADFRGTKDGCSEVPPLPTPKPVSTTTRLTSFPVSGRQCSSVHEGYCSVEFLSKYFGGNAEKASIVCSGESHGIPDNLNNNCKTNDYSVGLFQINLVGSCRGAYGAGSWGSQSCDNLISIDKRNTCEVTWKDVDANIRQAVVMSGSGSKWSPAWGVAKACGIR